MAYCVKCGIEIAEGCNFCPRCGAAQHSGSAAQQAEEPKVRDAESAHDTAYDEKRRRNQEYYRKWADNERDRRARETANNPRERILGKLEILGSKLSEAADRFLKDKEKKSKLISALCYLGPLCFLPRFICPDDEFARFHGRQGAKLLVAVILATIVGEIIDVAFAVRIFQVIMVAIGLRNSVNGETEPLPLIGNLKFFEKL